MILKLLRSWKKKKEGAGNENFQSFIESVEKMSLPETSIPKLSDEIQFLNEAMQCNVQTLNNPEYEMLLKKLYINRLEELRKELQDKVFLFNNFVFLIIDNQISGLK